MAERVEHTPGPLRVGHMTMDPKAWAALNDKRYGLVVVQKGEDVLAVVWGNKENGENDEGNATLYATAPALLAACEVAEVTIEDARHHDYDMEHRDRLARALDTLQSAIAQARGTR